MVGETVLLTGGTGFVGFNVLRIALEHGYKVRAAVRSEAKANAVMSNLKSITSFDFSLSFVVIPDFTVPGAFDDAAKGVEYIIHVASPMPDKVQDDYYKSLVVPAIDATIGIFESAKKASTVKRIVVTSSISAIFPVTGYMAPLDTVIGPDSRIPEFDGPYPNSTVAYWAAKIATLNRSEAWTKKEKPAFDIITLCPSLVYGRDDMLKSAQDFRSGSNMYLLDVALGQPDTERPAFPCAYAHIDEAARLHVLALDPKIEGNQLFIVSNTGQGEDAARWEEVHDIASKHFPEAVKDGRLPKSGTFGTTPSQLDTSKTTETFKFKPASFEECVVSVVGYYLELLERERNT